jgi:hypothetical protein
MADCPSLSVIPAEETGKESGPFARARPTYRRREERGKLSSPLIPAHAGIQIFQSLTIEMRKLDTRARA